METIGGRLKEERIKLGFKQEKFAEMCGVKKGAQINYEQGKRKPDSHYLMNAHRIGVDLNYVLTGESKLDDNLKPICSDKTHLTNKVDQVEQMTLITSVNKALTAVGLSGNDEKSVNKILPIYNKLTAEKPYNSRDAIGKQHFDDMLKLIAEQLI